MVGLTSWGYGCASLPGVFARISKGFDWFEEKICKASDYPSKDVSCPSATPTTSPTTPKPTTSNPSTSPTTAIPTVRQTLAQAQSEDRLIDTVSFFLSVVPYRV